MQYMVRLGLWGTEQGEEAQSMPFPRQICPFRDFTAFRTLVEKGAMALSLGGGDQLGGLCWPLELEAIQLELHGVHTGRIAGTLDPVLSFAYLD
jgi:hypothetical protein